MSFAAQQQAGVTQDNKSVGIPVGEHVSQGNDVASSRVGGSAGSISNDMSSLPPSQNQPGWH